jgi:Tfp pilus assembly protein PilN
MIEINLLPGAQAKNKQGGFNTAAFAGAIGDQLQDRFLLGAIAAVIVAIAAIGGMYVVQSRAEAAATDRQVAVARDSAQFSSVLVARARAQTTRDSVYQQLAIIKSIDDSRFTWPHLLEEINLALPPYTWLTGVLQTSPLVTVAGRADTSKAKADSAKHANAKDEDKAKRAHADSLFNGAATTMTFRIVGQTVDIQALTLFMKNLEASPFIKNVQLTRSDLITGANNHEVTEFQLEAETEVPPPSMIETVPLTLAVR